MATTGRDERNLYGDTLGAGGKFRKRPFRRTTQATPYDRPPTSIANPSNVSWLSKLVDPAQKLITSSAHRLFASVFRKRLPPPPPPPPRPPEPEASKEAKENFQEALSTGASDLQNQVLNVDNHSCHADGELVELEKILKQKTFTRSEIDRLTTLLHSRTVDISDREEKSSKAEQLVLHDRKKASQFTPVQENGPESHLVSTPDVSASVLDEDAASPAEVAKAYMGSRPSKVSASMLSLRSQALREDSTFLSNRVFPPKSPAMSLVPRSSGHVGVVGNGSVTPRLRGRSAIYSMVRTSSPYSRVSPATSLKGPAADTLDGPSSSSQNAWDRNRLSASREGLLKRRSSVLDDVKSGGPIRRIRQKSNLLSSKGLSLSSSGSPLAIHEDVDTQCFSSPMQKPGLLGEAKHSLGMTSIENGDNSIPGTSFTPIPSKSSEMASKILQQLDKLVSSREKSPTKLSPSMLRGPALKSLENVDSSKLLEKLQGDSKLDVSHMVKLPNIRESTSDKQKQVVENGPEKLVSHDKPVLSINGVAMTLSKESMPSFKFADSSVFNSVTHPPQQKRRAFQMSAHEDYLELDDDDRPNGAVSTSLADGRGNLDGSSVDGKVIAVEAVSVQKTPAVAKSEPPKIPVMNQESQLGASAEPLITEGREDVTFSTSHVLTKGVQSPVALQSVSTIEKASTCTKELNTVPVFSFGEKTPQSKEVTVAAPKFSFSSSNLEKAPLVDETSDVKLSATSGSKADSSSLAFTSIVAEPVLKATKADNTAARNTSEAGAFLRVPETVVLSVASTSQPAGSIFNFGPVTSSSSLSNGSPASSPFLFTSPSKADLPSSAASQTSSSFTLFNSSTTTAATATITKTTVSSTSGLSTQASSVVAPTFKFSSSAELAITPSPPLATSSERNMTVVSSGVATSASLINASSFSSSGSIFGTPQATVISTSAATSSMLGTGNSIFGSTSATVSSDTSIFGGPAAIPDTGSGMFSSAPLTSTSTGSGIFSGTSATASTGSGMFAFGAPPASTAVNQPQGSIAFTSGMPQSSDAGSIATTTKSMPIQFDLPASSSSFGMVGNTTLSSGSSLFGSSSVAKPFDSGAIFGAGSSTSSTTAVSSSSQTTTGLFGSSWQAPKAPVFGSTFSSSAGFSFGASSVSSATSNSAPMVFGSSTGASTSSIFSFSSPASTASRSVFGTVSPVFLFASAPSGNNDQMEDSMAEDTVQAVTPAPSAFNQAVSPPASGFFCGAAPQSGASSFQFGSQQNMLTPQNPSPFQASGSLEFNAGGSSFSLGTGAADKANRRIIRVKHKQRKK